MSQELIFFAILILLIFFISRMATNELYILLKNTIGIDRLIFLLLSLIYLPGTILHELSHFFAASAMLLRVREVTFIPRWKENYLSLGSVLYEKKDLIRSILVGIAPFFAGLAFFFVVSASKIFPNPNPYINILLIYLIFAVSSTMFSSSSDLRDVIFVFPFLIAGLGFFYIFGIDIGSITSSFHLGVGIEGFLRAVNQYLLLSLIINGGAVVLLKILKKILW